MVQEVVEPSDFGDVLKNNSLVLVDFFATWCGPCVAVAPVLEELEKLYAAPASTADTAVEADATTADADAAKTVAGPRVKFLKVDVDKHPSLSQEHEVMAMPTFMIFQDAKLIKTIVGANVPLIKGTLEKLTAAPAVEPVAEVVAV